MQIGDNNTGMAGNNIYHALNVLNSDLSFYMHHDNYDEKNFTFETTLVGSAALALLANENGARYTTDSKDVDLYTNSQLADIETFEKIPNIVRGRPDKSQYFYNTSSSSTAINPPETVIDIITDYENAFQWDKESSNEVEALLEQEIQGKPIIDGAIKVHLPSLETLEKTFDYSNRDYEDRIQLINELK